MTNDNPGTRASLEQLADSLRTAPKYCNEHKPCDAKEHAPGYQLALSLTTVLFGSLVYGLAIMFGVNMVLADWLGVVPPLGYRTAIMGTVALYALREIAKL